MLFFGRFIFYNEHVIMYNNELTMSQALQQLKHGYTLRTLSGKPVLLSIRDTRILVSGQGYTLRLEEDDFIELFGSEKFVIHNDGFELDEARDQEYYAWRSKSQ